MKSIHLSQTVGIISLCIEVTVRSTVKDKAAINARPLTTIQYQNQRHIIYKQTENMFNSSSHNSECKCTCKSLYQGRSSCTPAWWCWPSYSSRAASQRLRDCSWRKSRTYSLVSSAPAESPHQVTIATSTTSG